MYFDRFDICEAYYMFAMNHHEGQWSEIYAIFGRLHRMQFKMRPLRTSSARRELSSNGLAIYHNLIRRYNH